jgi:hypothetical protein
MAAHARLAWSLRYESRDSGPISHRCTYLNADGELVFDGLEKQQWLPVNDVRVALDELAALHGATLTPEKQPTPGERALAARIGELVLAGDGHAGLHRWHAALPPVHGLSIEATLVPSEIPAASGLEFRWAGYKGAPEADHTYSVDHTAGRRFVANVPRLDEGNFGAQGVFGGSSVEAAAKLLGNGDAESGLGMLRAVFDGDLPPVSGKKAFKFWRWLCSDWFETWVDSMIGAKLGTAMERLANVRIGTPVLQNDQRPELDVLAGVGFRTLCVSVTVASDAYTVRHKAFEALTRAATLAGDHGRYLVVCLADTEDVLQRVADDIASHWEGPDTFRVIGLPHLRGLSAPTSSRRRAGNSPRQTLDELFTEWFPGVAR